VQESLEVSTERLEETIMSEKLDEKTEDHVKIIEDRPSDLSRLDIGRNSSLVLIRKTRNVS
jgi:hypothetical protein